VKTKDNEKATLRTETS